MYPICDRLYLDIHKNEEETLKIIKNSKDYITSTEFHESYMPLKNDYGPMNIGSIINFCDFIDDKMQCQQLSHRNIVYYIYLLNDRNNAYLLNAVFMMGCYLIIKKNICVDKVIFDILHIFNAHPCYFIDCISEWGGYYSSIMDCLRAISFVYKNDIEELNNFDIEDYEYLTDFSQRDMNIIANKFIAMRCPSQKNIHDVCNELKKRNVKLVIRLNKDNNYDSKIFENQEIDVLDLYFDDYSVPSIKIIKKFMNAVNDIDYSDKVAIHCRAGLGRTGILICIWLIIKLNFKPAEAIAYIRIMRPGSIMGSQGFFLESIEYFKRFI
jgi:cell division cycle 14